VGSFRQGIFFHHRDSSRRRVELRHGTIVCPQRFGWHSIYLDIKEPLIENTGGVPFGG